MFLLNLGFEGMGGFPLPLLCIGSAEEVIYRVVLLDSNASRHFELPVHIGYVCLSEVVQDFVYLADNFLGKGIQVNLTSLVDVDDSIGIEFLDSLYSQCSEFFVAGNVASAVSGSYLDDRSVSHDLFLLEVVIEFVFVYVYIITWVRTFVNGLFEIFLNLFLKGYEPNGYRSDPATILGKIPDWLIASISVYQSSLRVSPMCFILIIR